MNKNLMETPAQGIDRRASQTPESENYKEVSKVLAFIEKGLNNYRENYGYIELKGNFDRKHPFTYIEVDLIP